MSQEQLSMYATYMSVLGNREDLFGDSPYVDKYITNPPADYDVNPEYLNERSLRTLITEAEKYLGYPYVWGGSNPDTSFDCSGFVSYVLTNSGLVNTGRLGAQGLYNVCTPVSKANAQPGDLIFSSERMTPRCVPRWHLCWRWGHDPLRRSHSVHIHQLFLLAAAFLRLRKTRLLKERSFA